MKKIIIYKIDSDNDADYRAVKCLEESFNRLVNFAPELFPDNRGKKTAKEDRTPEMKAFNRVAVNGEFENSDYATLRGLADRIRLRITERDLMVNPPFPPEQEFLLREERNQAMTTLFNALVDIGSLMWSC